MKKQIIALMTILTLASSVRAATYSFAVKDRGHHTMGPFYKLVINEEKTRASFLFEDITCYSVSGEAGICPAVGFAWQKFDLIFEEGLVYSMKEIKGEVPSEGYSAIEFMSEDTIDLHWKGQVLPLKKIVD